MALSIEVDRGSVWYDFPYTDSGRPKRQRRKYFPTLNLMLDYNGKRFPLVSWRTTIGGWFEEMAENGYVYLKYKQSDVGKRILRRVVAAPTWRPPASTPVDTLRKRRWLNGKAQNVVSYGSKWVIYQLDSSPVILPLREQMGVLTGIRGFARVLKLHVDIEQKGYSRLPSLAKMTV